MLWEELNETLGLTITELNEQLFRSSGISVDTILLQIARPRAITSEYYNTIVVILIDHPRLFKTFQIMDSKDQAITVQIGSYANLVCAHLWNNRQHQYSNDSNTDASYHTYEGRSGAQHPRCVIVDHSSNFGGLEAFEKSDAAEENNFWPSQKIEKFERPVAQRCSNQIVLLVMQYLSITKCF